MELPWLHQLPAAGEAEAVTKPRGAHKPLQGPDVLVKQVTPVQSTGFKLGKIGGKVIIFLRGPIVGQPQVPKVRFPILEHQGRFISQPRDTRVLARAGSPCS